MSEFTLEFQNTKNDFPIFTRKLAKSCVQRNMSLAKKYHLDSVSFSFFFMIGGILIAQLAGFPISGSLGEQVTLIILIAATFLLNALIRSKNLLAAMAPDPDGWFLQPQTHEYSEDGLVIRSAGNMCKYTWRLLWRIEEDTDRFYLLVDNAIGYVVPKSAFSDEDEARRWLEYCESHIAAAHA